MNTTKNNTCTCSKPACDIWSPYYDGTCRYCGKLVDLSEGDADAKVAKDLRLKLLLEWAAQDVRGTTEVGQ